MTDLNSLFGNFFSLYKQSGQRPRLFFAPGRVNLIGEHTDYNGGFVFPCALNFGTYLLIREHPGNDIRFASTNMEYKVSIPLNELGIKHEDHWVNYPLGVIDQFKKKGIRPAGMDLLYSGDIPNGAGLSSSASIELVTAFALEKILSTNLGTLELVKLSQRAENEFVGMNCGIMDQFAVGMGSKNKALFLNCDTLDYELVSLDLQNYQLIIANTNKRRGLTDSKYNERRTECETAVGLIQKKKEIRNLSDLDLQKLKKLRYLIENPVVYKRAHHVVGENERVLDAVAALKKGNLQTFGQLMNASHNSLKNDYEVTGPELDALVEEAGKVAGVLGSRMTGAGFGGCTVSIVLKTKVKKFCETVGQNYNKRTGLKAEFYLPEIGDGVREIML